MIRFKINIFKNIFQLITVFVQKFIAYISHGA